MLVGADIHNPVVEYLIKLWRLDNPGVSVIRFEDAHESLRPIPGHPISIYESKG